MTQGFTSTNKKLENWLSAQSENLKVSGATANQWLFIINSIMSATANSELSKRSHVFVCPDADSAENLYSQLKQSEMADTLFLYYPGLEQSPFSSIIASEHDLFSRFRVLHTLSHSTKRVFVVTHCEALFLKMPTLDFFRDKSLKLVVEDIISPDELAAKLIGLGYESAVTVEEPGTFCKKGEVFDIFPVSSLPIRLHYFDDLIEKIYPVDLATNKTMRDVELSEINIGPTPHSVKTGEFPTNLRSNIPIPGANYKSRFETRKRFFENLKERRLFDEYPKYFPLFFEKTRSLAEILTDENFIFHEIENLRANQIIDELIESFREEKDIEDKDPESTNLIQNISDIYNFQRNDFKSIQTNAVELEVDFNEGLGNKLEYRFEPFQTWINSQINPTLEKAQFINELFKLIAEKLGSGFTVLMSVSSDKSKQEIRFLMEEDTHLGSKYNKIQWTRNYTDEGFFYDSEKILLISEADIFTKRKKKTKTVSKKQTDLFAEQIATLKSGDYVIHSSHGIGVYKGLETMNFGGKDSDFLVVEYEEGDKVYVPVYKINLLQKHADSSASLKPANLRSNSFEKLKVKARKSIKTLAFDLLRLQAKRESETAYAFSPPDKMFYEFENEFHFSATPDQVSAINDVVKNMQKPKPMDHLVCGDVGFGKTEVAMRAAYKAVLDGKQVAVLVPTTILALQHYNSFVKRYKKFPVSIDFLTRFKNPKETKETLERVAEGKVDIIIGTHKLLSDKLKFKDLGLVIVDEEQRFGVGHKEKLKLLKASVDFLTLTATPIPRTLQLAFLGLRELSLIQTAPPKRQSIKTYLIKEDDFTLKSAIEKELSRGGQVFIVHNKVQDIEQFQGYIKELVPTAKIVYAHGQMAEKDLEKRMTDFYMGKYQILISTTIIESGLDIPNANTMIIDRADTFGLSQLHQLRGRIGRSDKKAYAYFVIPKNRNLTPVAEKRLKALQTYADIGSGFSIANSDLEIRGAGDILGASQSGHIEAIGLELYTELLKEEIMALKGEEPESVIKDIEVSTPHRSYLPSKYIPDPGERLKTYKRLSNAKTLEILDDMWDELADVFGPIPQEVINLFHVLRARVVLAKTGIKNVQLFTNTIKLVFDKAFVDSHQELREKIITTFTSDPKSYQLSPDYSVTVSKPDEISLEQFLHLLKDIAQQIVPC